jgi:hypothetical protein
VPGVVAAVEEARLAGGVLPPPPRPAERREPFRRGVTVLPAKLPSEKLCCA